MLITGKCHCGNIAFELTWSPDPAQIPARACTCSFCVKHAGVWTSTSQGILSVAVADAALTVPYMFGTKTAQFHVCRQCGVVPVVTSRIDGNLYAVVNVHAFEGDARTRLAPAAAASFDGEDEPARLARRKRNWIPAVRFA